MCFSTASVVARLVGHVLQVLVYVCAFAMFLLMVNLLYVILSDVEFSKQPMLWVCVVVFPLASSWAVWILVCTANSLDKATSRSEFGFLLTSNAFILIFITWALYALVLAPFKSHLDGFWISVVAFVGMVSLLNIIALSTAELWGRRVADGRTH